jgi:3-methyladenine DNA glycosylase AlkD
VRGPADRLGLALDARANAKSREWWERYLKGAVPFRGVKMAGVRATIHALWHDERLGERPQGAQIDLALALFESRYAEDKLAGVLALSEILLPALTVDDVPRLASAFAHVDDWGTCDWYCVKALGRFVAAGSDGRERAEAIAAWTSAESLWQRRAAGVAFVNHAPHGEAFFAGFVDLLLGVCGANVRDPARFSQTGVGWVLRELSKAEPARVRTFVSEHEGALSTEARRMATARLDGRGRRR